MKKLTILCVPLSGMGHINPTITVASALKSRGHRVVFAVERSWRGRLELFGFEEEIYDEREISNEKLKCGKNWAAVIAQKIDDFKLPPMQRRRGIIDTFLGAVQYSHTQMEAILKRVKPDLIIEDLLLFMPSLLATNAPIVTMYTMNPLYAFNTEQLPPPGGGLPLDDDTDWKKFRKVRVDVWNSEVKKFNDWLQTINSSIPKLKGDEHYTSTNLRIFVYPKAAVGDYLQKFTLGPEWIGVDHCIRESGKVFELPKELQERDGKLILLSLGSLGSSLVELMKRLTGLLSKSEHKFIVVKGHMHDEYELPDNMWGEAVLPQLELLPLVDLVITHGGNNTFVESLYFGKPMIVLPLFGDQFDNAQRAVEMKIGCRFNPFTVSEDELNNAIRFLLSDSSVTKKLTQISNEMKTSKSMETVVERIEFVAKHPKFPTIAPTNCIIEVGSVEI